MSQQRLPKLSVANEGTKNKNNKSPRSRHLLKRFGITELEYESLLQRQGGACAVCRRPAEYFRKRLCVDHDHYTGAVRGLLCIHCNRYVVGKHRRDKGAELLRSAYEYLTKEYPGWIVPKKKRRKKHARRKR